VPKFCVILAATDLKLIKMAGANLFRMIAPVFQRALFSCLRVAGTAII
jgi:hypothetical protein